MFEIKSGRLSHDGTDTDYIRFGSGKKVLILLPGLGDGLRTVKGTAPFMALLYRDLGKDYTVYAFSRRNNIPAGFTTQDMAQDIFVCMKMLGINKASVMGVSMGGMIAQHLAADHPEAVEKLVLVVTCPQPNNTLKSSVRLWMSQAKDGDHNALMDSNLRFIYSPAYYKKNKHLIPLVAKITKPASYERFLILAEACLSHNALEKLCNIQAPTLIIGGEKDKTLGVEASRQMHAIIPESKLLIYPEGYHGLYEEEKDFNSVVLEFL